MSIQGETEQISKLRNQHVAELLPKLTASSSPSSSKTKLSQWPKTSVSPRTLVSSNSKVNCNFSESFQQLYANYFTRNWTSLDTSSAFHRNRVLLVRMQSANPFFDDSYAVSETIV